MTSNLAGVIKILGGAVITLLKSHVVLGFVEQIFFKTQAVLLWFGPHPFGTFANLNGARLINDHD